MATNFKAEIINDMLAKFYDALRSHRSPNTTKELVFDRMRAYKAEGYAEDVAFAKALKDYGFDCTKKKPLNEVRNVVRYPGILCSVELKTGASVTMGEKNKSLHITWPSGKSERIEQDSSEWRRWYEWFFVQTGVFAC